jgi:transcriptional regulator with XRE-family HTH domain
MHDCMVKHATCQVFGCPIMLLETEKPPNKQTKAMGELIRKAREEAGLSQEQLAEKIYRRRLAVSEMENGKVEISAWTIPLLAHALNKPITYFYPNHVLKQLTPEELSSLEQELLIHFSNISSDHLREVAIDLVKVVSQFDPKEMLIDRIDTIIELDKMDEELKSFLERKRLRGSKGA